MRERSFGDLELEVLQTLKKHGRMTVKEVLGRIGGETKYTTVMTVMNRLYEKGRLAREKEGHSYAYWLIDPGLEMLMPLKRKLFGISPVELVSHLIETNEDLSHEDLQEMARLIEKAKQRRT